MFDDIRTYCTLLYQMTHGKRPAEQKHAVRLFAQHLVSMRKVHLLDDIMHTFPGYARGEAQSAPVVIESVHRNTPNVKRTAGRFARKIFPEAKHIEIIEKITPECIGGIRLRIDDRLYDGTVAGMIKKLAQHLVSRTR